MRTKALGAKAPALDAYLAWVRGGEGWPRVPGDRCPACQDGYLVSGPAPSITCAMRYEPVACKFVSPLIVDGVAAELRRQVLLVGDDSQRSRWRLRRRAPGTAYRAELARLTQGTHTPIPFYGWPGDKGYAPRMASKARVAKKRAA